MGYIRKALEKGYLEHPGLHVVLPTCFRFCPSWMMPVLLAASFCQHAATMFTYKFTPRAVASPDAPQKPLVHKRACSRGAEWVQVTRHPTKQAKKPRTIVQSVHSNNRDPWACRDKFAIVYSLTPKGQ